MMIRKVSDKSVNAMCSSLDELADACSPRLRTISGLVHEAARAGVDPATRARRTSADS